MTGTLAQIVALAAYGNDYLINGNLPVSFYPGNSTFQFCSKVDFREFRKPFFFLKHKEYLVADTPAEWLKYLKKDGCKKLRLYFEYTKKGEVAVADHKMAGFVGGGGTWYIEAVYKNHSNYWANKWEVAQKDAPDRKIWSVSYGMISGRPRTQDLKAEVRVVKEQLTKTLEEIGAFAYRNNLQNWGKWFDKARAVADSARPNEEFYHKDLMPLNHYSLAAQQLLFAAGNAWVFGGMGSWNDEGFDDAAEQQLYDKLSARLYHDIKESIITAVNSY